MHLANQTVTLKELLDSEGFKTRIDVKFVSQLWLHQARTVPKDCVNNSLVAFSLEEFPFSTVSFPFGPCFPVPCSLRKTKKHDLEDFPSFPAKEEAWTMLNIFELKKSSKLLIQLQSDQQMVQVFFVLFSCSEWTLAACSWPPDLLDPPGPTRCCCIASQWWCPSNRGH